MTAGTIQTPPAAMLEGALEWASRGIAVFPAFIKVEDGERKKLPYVKWGKGVDHRNAPLKDRRATTDRLTIREWWEKWPNALICAPTGPDNGFFVVEGDVRAGGDDALAQLLAEHDPEGVQKTRTHFSATGGPHLLYRYPTDGRVIRNQGAGKKRLPAGVDVRGAGGMVVLPPSYRRDIAKAYTVANDMEIAAAPEWLLALVTEEDTSTTSARQGRQDSADWVALLDTGVRQGEGRNPTLARYGAHLHAIGMDPDEVAALLRLLNDTRVYPKLSDSNVAKIAADTFKFVTQDLGGIASRDEAVALEAELRDGLGVDWAARWDAERTRSNRWKVYNFLDEFTDEQLAALGRLFDGDQAGADITYQREVAQFRGRR